MSFRKAKEKIMSHIEYCPNNHENNLKISGRVIEGQKDRVANIAGKCPVLGCEYYG